MKYGYGRVSTSEQHSENQRQVIALQQKSEIDEWFEDSNVSGKTKAVDRPEFARMLSKVVAGDEITFTRVDRIGRKTSDVLNTVEGLLADGIEVYILQLGATPLSSPMGKVMLGVFAIFAENERDSIIERTIGGINRTRAEGTKFGAPFKITPKQLSEMVTMSSDGLNMSAIAEKFKLPRNTVDRAMKNWGDKLDEYTKEYAARKAQHKANKLKREKGNK